MTFRDGPWTRGRFEMVAALMIERAFWTVVLLVALKETGYSLGRSFPFVRRGCPGPIGRIFARLIAASYSEGKLPNIDFDEVFSGRPLGPSASIYKDVIRHAQLLLAGSWICMYAAIVIIGFS